MHGMADVAPEQREKEAQKEKIRAKAMVLRNDLKSAKSLRRGRGLSRVPSH